MPSTLPNNAKTALILLLLSLPLIGANAAQGQTYSYGAGSLTCAQFGEEYGKNTSSELTLFSWTQGWLTGLNSAEGAKCGQQRTMRDLASVSIDTQMMVIREYCAVHPLEQYTQAIAFMRDKYLRPVILPPQTCPEEPRERSDK